MTEPLSKKDFLVLLRAINFAERFYSLYARHAQETPFVTDFNFLKQINRTGLEFPYRKSGSFYQHEEFVKGAKFGLHLAVLRGRVELILNVVGPDHTPVGAPYALLAEQVTRLVNPDFKHDPPYPKIAFGSPDSFGDVVQEAVSLFKATQASVLEHLNDAADG